MKQDRPTLRGRRCDWLVHKVYSGISENQVQRQAANMEGHRRNIRSYEAVTRAILKAKAIEASDVVMGSPGSYVVSTGAGSQTEDSGVPHTVSICSAGQGQASCTCLAGQKGALCKHVVKVLQLSGATEAQLLEHLGIYKGSKYGGFRVLFDAMAAAAMAAEQQQQPAAADISGADAVGEPDVHPPPDGASAAGAAL